MTKTKDAREALKMIVETLAQRQNNKYYAWTSMGNPPVWLLRIPLASRDDNTWSKEMAAIVHICNPLKFAEALEKNQQNEFSISSGYVEDEKCMRCEREIPQDVNKKFTIQLRLHKFSKKIDG